MSGKAARVTLTATMYDILQRLTISRTIPANIAARIQIVLSAFQGQNNAQMSSAVHLGAQQVEGGLRQGLALCSVLGREGLTFVGWCALVVGGDSMPRPPRIKLPTVHFHILSRV